LNQLNIFGSPSHGSVLSEDAVKFDQIKTVIGLILILVAAMRSFMSKFRESSVQEEN